MCHAVCLSDSNSTSVIGIEITWSEDHGNIVWMGNRFRTPNSTRAKIAAYFFPGVSENFSSNAHRIVCKKIQIKQSNTCRKIKCWLFFPVRNVLQIHNMGLHWKSGVGLLSSNSAEDRTIISHRKVADGNPKIYSLIVILTMEHKSDGDTNCNWCTRCSHQKIGTGTRGLGNKRMSGDHPNFSSVEISQYTEKSPEEFKRLAVVQTPVEIHPPTLVWKTPKRIK